MRTWARIYLNPVTLYVLLFLLVALLEEVGAIPHLAAVIVACLGAITLVVWMKQQAHEPGLHTKLYNTEGERDEARRTLVEREAELSKMRRGPTEVGLIPLEGEGGVLHQLADKVVESFFNQMEDFPPQEVADGWERDLRAAIVAGAAKLPYFFDPGKRVLMPRRVTIVRMPPAAARDEMAVAVQCVGIYMQTSDLVIGLWDDGSAAVGKHFTEGPVEVTVTPARTA